MVARAERGTGTTRRRTRGTAACKAVGHRYGAADAGPRAISPVELIVRSLDVGQGDAILIQNGGSTVLIDGGPDPRLLGAHLGALA